MPSLLSTPFFKRTPHHLPPTAIEVSRYSEDTNKTMAPTQALLSSRGLLCHRCLLAYTRGRVAPVQRRNISTKYLQKMEEAEEKWQERAELIREGKLQNTWDLFEERGYVKDTAGYVGLPPSNLPAEPERFFF